MRGRKTYIENNAKNILYFTLYLVLLLLLLKDYILVVLMKINYFIVILSDMIVISWIFSLYNISWINIYTNQYTNQYIPISAAFSSRSLSKYPNDNSSYSNLT